LVISECRIGPPRSPVKTRSSPLAGHFERCSPSSSRVTFGTGHRPIGAVALGRDQDQARGAGQLAVDPERPLQEVEPVGGEAEELGLSEFFPPI
jgi:hypothetical protein